MRKQIFLGKTTCAQLYSQQIFFFMNIVALRIYFGFENGLLEGELEVTCTLKP